MNAQLRGPGDFEPEDDDDRIERRAEDLAERFAADAVKLAEIDSDASETLDGSDYTSMFSQLADLSASGLLQQLAEGEPVGSFGHKAEVFASLARLADRMQQVRTAAVAEAAREQAELESRDWPQWRGTAHATQFLAQLHGSEA